MQDYSHSLASDLVTAVLQGGPLGFPEALRTQQVSADQEKIKVPYLGGYEHFEHNGDSAGDPDGPIVYRWTMRTKIAE